MVERGPEPDGDRSRVLDGKGLTESTDRDSLVSRNLKFRLWTPVELALLAPQEVSVDTMTTIFSVAEKRW